MVQIHSEAPKKDNIMTLDEFIKQMREDIEIFEAYWKARNRGNSKFFPMELEPGEWDEQFMITHQTDHEEED